MAQKKAQIKSSSKRKIVTVYDTKDLVLPAIIAGVAVLVFTGNMRLSSSIFLAVFFGSFIGKMLRDKK